MTVPAARALLPAVAAALALSLPAPRPAAANATTGAWSGVLDWPLVAVHMAQLPTGEILIWSNKPNEEPHLLDPAGDCFEAAGGCFTEKPNPVNLFCGGHTHLDDGSVIANGGHVQNNVGEAETFLFQHDKETGDWNWTPVGEIEDTGFARWYPTLTSLPDGRVLNVSGSELRCNGGVDDGELCLEDADCDAADCSTRLIAPPELYDPATRSWRTLSLITESVEFYPFNFVDLDGGVFFAGADDGADVFDVAPTQSATFDVAGQSVTLGAASAHAGGSAVMYEPGRILKTGGTDAGSAAIADAEVIDLGGAAVWAATSPMNIPRRRHNLTVLPDGTVLVTGGTRLGNREFEIERTCGGTDDGASCNNDGACPPNVDCEVHPMGAQLWVAEAEIWDPSTGDWTLMAGAQVPRMYHSTAVLLPDGRVLSAGGGRGGGAVHSYRNAEIFSPPYLFTGTQRPLIGEAPEIIHYGETFEVSSPEAADVGRVSLVRLAAVTHSFDQDRRFVPLSFAAGDGELAVDAPAGPNLAPPGYYMLFLVSEEGVPSVARFVRLLPADPGAGASFEYAAKVVCGVPDDAARHAPGFYSTSVNLHNPGPGPVRFFKKLALTYPPGDQRAGAVLPLGIDELGYDEALQTDCRELRRKLVPTSEAPFLEGFLVVQSQGRLDATAVYATAAVGANGAPTAHSSIDVEPVPERDRRLDLETTKKADHFCIPIGDRFAYCFVLYEVLIENHGPNAAHGVVVEDEATRPGGLLAVVPNLFEVEPAGSAVVETALGETVALRAEIPELAAGEVGEFRFWVFALVVLSDGPVDPALAPFVPKILVNVATVSADEPDAAPGNDSAEIVTVLP